MLALAGRAIVNNSMNSSGDTTRTHVALVRSFAIRSGRMWERWMLSITVLIQAVTRHTRMSR